MTVMTEPRPARTSEARPPLPREHGAWGILLIPFAGAVGAAGVWNLPVALLLVSILCFYLARTSYLKANRHWMILLLATSAAATVPLLLMWKLWWLAAFGAVAVPLAFRQTKRSVAMQLLAVVAALWWPVGLAFVPVILRAFAGVARLSPVLRIKRLGWTEVAHSLVFLIILVALLR